MRSTFLFIFATLGPLGCVLALPPFSQLECIPGSEYPADYVKQRDNFGNGLRAVQTRENAKPKRKCFRTGTFKFISAFKQSDALILIDGFCSVKNDFWDGAVIVPDVSIGTEMTKSGKPKRTGIHDSLSINGGKDLLWIDVKFNYEGVGGGFFTFPQGNTNEEKIQNCQNSFLEVVNGCDTGGPAGQNHKHGGTVFKGFAKAWSMAAAPKDTPNPILATPPSQLGAFQCEDTNTSAIGGTGSSLFGTCTCWYQKRKNLQDTFCKPKNGGCASILTPPDWSTRDEKC